MGAAGYSNIKSKQMLHTDRRHDSAQWVIEQRWLENGLREEASPVAFLKPLQGINRSSEARRNNLGSGHSIVSTPLNPHCTISPTTPLHIMLLCPSLSPSGKTLAQNPLGDTFSHVWAWTQTQLFPSPSNTAFAQLPVHDSPHRAFLIFS